MGSEEKLTWTEFLAAVAGAGGFPPDGVEESSRVVEDLGIDSLALAEVVLVLITELRMDRLSEELAARDWTNVRLGDLYEEYRYGRRPPQAEELAVPVPPQT